MLQERLQVVQQWLVGGQLLGGGLLVLGDRLPVIIEVGRSSGGGGGSCRYSYGCG